MKRSLGVLAAVGVGVLSMSGCASPSAGTDGEQQTVRLLVNITPNLTQEFWEELVAGFEDENPNVDVKVEAPVTGDIGSTITQLVASDDLPDVVNNYTPDADTAPLFVDFTDQAWLAETPDGSAYNIGGGQYAVGAGVQPQSLVFYNKTAFEEAGIDEPPVTVDEFGDALAKLQDAGWTPMQTAGEWVTSAQFLQLSIPNVAAQQPDWRTEVRDGTTTLSKVFGPSIERYADWIASGFTPADALGVGYEEAQAAFLAGESAIYPMGSWFIAAAAAEEPTFEIGVFFPPVNEGVEDAPTAGGLGGTFAVFDTDAKEASLKLVEYLTTTEAATEYAKADSFFRPSAQYETTQLGTDAQALVSEHPKLTPPSSGVGEDVLPGFSEELEARIQGLYVGKTAAEVGAELDNWWNSQG